MGKRCLFCGQFFIPDPRVGDRQKACDREPCKKKRKTVAQRRWCENNPGYFRGRYPYVKQWCEQKKLSSGGAHPGMIQDKIPLLEPCLRLILVIPGAKDGMIQDEIRLRPKRGTKKGDVGSKTTYCFKEKGQNVFFQ